MSHPYKFLVATDYSTASRTAEIYALQMAAKTNSLITFFHAYDPPLPPAKITESYDKLLVQSSQEERKRLEAHARDVTKQSGLSGLNIESEAKQGSASHEILRFASAICADLIVLGTHGSSGKLDLLLGSHTWSVMSKAGVPVLAVPQDTHFKDLKKMIWATEGREGEWPGLKFSTELARRLGVSMESVHVKKDETGLPEKFRRKAQAMAPESPLKEITGSDVIGSLREHAKNSGAGMILVSHERILWLQKLWGSDSGITKKLSRLSELPVLSIPDHFHPEFENFWRTFSDDSSADEEF